MDKVNSPVGSWLRAISWVPNYGAVVQPSQNAVEPADSSFGDRVQVLGLRGVRHAADGVGGMLGLAPNGLDTLDAVRLDEAGRRRTNNRPSCGRPRTAGSGRVDRAHVAAVHADELHWPRQRNPLTPGLQVPTSSSRPIHRFRRLRMPEMARMLSALPPRTWGVPYDPTGETPE